MARAATLKAERTSCDEVELNGRRMLHRWRDYKWGIKCVVCGLTIKHDDREPTPNGQYRNGGDLVEDREDGRDVLSTMSQAQRNPDMLRNTLRELGYSETGDDMDDTAD